ncbi:hypothetical protein RRG08_021753 [Elysia crispata]|uniref:Helicase-like transcription factor n=1 Tax=Elysia crispata TaxID=231223 RepID=A0AAE0ZZ82_9GAST|nr:hypothetical protein RRG08_021753 [Elysia crispata]
MKFWPAKVDSRIKKSRQRKKYMSPAHSRGNIWDTTLSQLSNLSGILEEPEPEVDLVDDSQDIQAETEDELFGTIRSDIVGVQYYKGTVSNNEMVNLVREPMNKYDQCALRVDNVTNEQVGHIKREHAKALSFVVDSNYAKVEGLIPFGANNKFRIPVVISLWGNSDKKAQALAVLKSHSISVAPNPVKRVASGSGLGLGTSLPGHTLGDYGHVVSQRTIVSPSEMESAMDQMFETLDEGDKTTEASPAQAIKTGLYPHQKQALNWMICRENKGILPPFWEKQGNMYINTLTICHTHIKPASVCGGIVADDMGLGKTLQVISLILTNFVDGKPLAWPMQGTLRCPIGVTVKKNVKSTVDKACIGSSGTSCENSQRTSISKNSTYVSCSSVATPHISEKSVAYTSPNLSAQQAKRSTPMNNIKDGERTNITPKEIVQAKSNYNTVIDSSVKKISIEDPDFIPDVSEKVIEVTPVSRSRRERKRPVQYCYSDEEIEKELEECTSDKGKRKKRSAGKKSTPLAVTDSNKVINLASCTKAFDDVKESKDLLKFPATQVVLTTMQDSKKANLEYNSVGEQIPDNLSFAQNSTGSELSWEKLHMDVVYPNKGGSTEESETKLVSEEILKMEDSLIPNKTLDSAEIIVIDDWDDSVKKDVAGKDCKFDVRFISDTSPTDKKTPSVSDFQQKTGIMSEKKLSKDVSSSQEPLFVVDSDDDDDLPDISPFVPETNSESIPDKLGSDYEAGTGRAKTAGPRGTLVICPLSVISNWVGQFEEHLHQQVHISLYVYYGGCRKKDLRLLREQDVVITTYSTLASDFKSVKKSPLHQVEWLRLVLDEGHIIRNPASQQAKAVFQLQARRKWVLTGTPIQNSMKDLWSLINFLGVKPFTDRTWWNRTIARPLAKRESKAIHRVSHLMRNLALRRTKNQQLNGRPLIALPKRHIYLEKIKFGEEERAVYEAMQENGQIIIGRYFSQGTLLHHYGEVLAILTRLRQLCCHPLLVASAVNKVLENNPGAAITEVFEPTAAGIPQAATPAPFAALAEEERQRLINQLLYVLNSGSDQECAICLDSIRRGVITACAHVYCRPCIEAVIENEQPNPKCPLCRAELSKGQLIEAPAENKRRGEDQNECGNAEERSAIEEEAESMWPTPETWQSSAKIDALMKGLIQLREQDPKIKSIVVSQFTSLLDLIEIPLGMQGFHFARLDGCMSASERVQAVEEFSAQNCSAPTVFLLSLKAGGVGINLTAASRVFLMDPAWNPASEEQCFDRCHRLGQTKDVVVTRFVIDDTVEDRMLELQEKKRQLMKGAFGRSQSREERRNNLVDMIRNLIRI